jgi:hypothetical protein
MNNEKNEELKKRLENIKKQVPTQKKAEKNTFRRNRHYYDIGTGKLIM